MLAQRFSPTFLILAVAALSPLPGAQAAVLLVSSGDSNSVLAYDATTGNFIRTFASGGGLEEPEGLTLGPDGNLNVTSRRTRCCGITGRGAFIDVFASGVEDPAGLVFGPDGNLYVSSEIEGVSGEVKRFDGTTGAFIDTFASGGGLLAPEGLTFGPDGNLYVNGGENNAALRYDDTTGAFIDVFAEVIEDPTDLVFHDGNLYVSSAETSEVLLFNGTTGEFIGVFASGGGAEETEGIAFGPDGNLYVASELTDEIFRYDGTTGAFIDIFVDEGSGGLAMPTFILFAPDIVPEPGTLALLSLGLLALGVVRRRAA